MTGRKDDAGKARWDLLPWRAIGRVVEVLTHGAARYGDDNWRQVGDARRRYFAAAHRHLAAWWEGEVTDSESGLPHLAHAVCCLVFLLHLELDHPPPPARSSPCATSSPPPPYSPF